MGRMKDLHITVYAGGDEAVAAVERIGKDWREQLEQAASEIERLRGERRWIPVSEVLPETRTNVLAYDGNFPHSVTSFRVVSLSIDGSQWFDQHTDEEHPVNAFTHWMPLPEPPAECP